jgi:hypothetical protein
MIDTGIIILVVITIFVIVAAILYMKSRSHHTSRSTNGIMQKKETYLQSKTGMYLVCDEGKKLAVSANMADATPLNIIKCKDTDGYCLFSKDNKAISISG